MSKREAYQQKLEAQIEEKKADLDKLKAKAKQRMADGKITVYEKIEAMEKQLEQFKGRLHELKKANDNRWEALKDGMESSWHTLSASVKKAFSKEK